MAKTAEEATIALVVVRRRIAGDAGAVGVTTPGTTIGGGTVAGVTQPTMTIPGVTIAVPIQRRASDTILRVGTYEKLVTSEDERYDQWKAAARRTVGR